MKKIQLADVLQNAVDIIFNNIKNISILVGIPIAFNLVFALLIVWAPSFMVSMGLIVAIIAIPLMVVISIAIVHQLNMAALGQMVSLQESFNIAKSHFWQYLLLFILLAVIAGVFQAIVMFVSGSVVLGVIARLLGTFMTSFLAFLTISILMFDTKNIIQAIQVNMQWMMQYVDFIVYLVAFVLISVPMMLTIILGGNVIFEVAGILCFLFFVSIAVVTYQKLKQQGVSIDHDKEKKE